MIIDTHTHVGFGKARATAQELENTMRASNITCSLVFPLKTDKDPYDESMAVLQHANSKLLPVLRFNPKIMSLEKLREIISQFSAVKLHPRGETFDPLDTKLEPVFKEIERSQKPVIIHTRKEGLESTDPERLLTLARRYPKIIFIFAHFASDSDEFFKQLTLYDNAYVETSMVSSPFTIAQRVKQVGSERILFGSDFPYSDQEIELLKIKKAPISELEKENILYKNAMKIFKIEKT